MDVNIQKNGIERAPPQEAAPKLAVGAFLDDNADLTEINMKNVREAPGAKSQGGRANS